jgi:hypothetical protein
MCNFSNIPKHIQRAISIIRPLQKYLVISLIIRVPLPELSAGLLNFSYYVFCYTGSNLLLYSGRKALMALVAFVAYESYC